MKYQFEPETQLEGYGLDTSLTRLLPRRYFPEDPSAPVADDSDPGGSTGPGYNPVSPGAEYPPSPACDCPTTEMICVKKSWWWVAAIAAVYVWSKK